MGSDPGYKYDDFYVVGGTLRPDAPSYIEREADRQLYERTLAGDYCFVLTPRQMGKSSLMARTASRLKEQGIHTVVVDLTQIGTEEEIDSPQKWYFGISFVIARELRLDVELETWWQERTSLLPLQRLTEFFTDIVLGKTSGQVVIFIDEIDTTIDLAFTDDFFAAIRACHNSRATKPQYKRLCFTLLGVASPADLIKNKLQTPYNIGERIDLMDFSIEEAKPLSRYLCKDSGQGEAALRRIHHWTGGHPYLTQKLCRLVAQGKMETCGHQEIDRLVNRQFFAPSARKEDPNLTFVNNWLTHRAKDSKDMLLKLYRFVYEEKSIQDDPLSPTHSALKLSGLVVPGLNRRLTVRNRIYHRVFDNDWLYEMLPKKPWNLQVVMFSVVAALIIVFFIAYIIFDSLAGTYSDVLRAAADEAPYSSYEKLSRIPFSKSQANKLFADYWERMVREADEQSKKDEAILFQLKALCYDDTPDRRNQLSRLMGEVYKKLAVTFRDDSRVNAVAFKPDNQTILTGGSDGVVRVWDVETGQPIKSVELPAGPVNSLAFSHDCKRVIGGYWDGRAQLYVLDTGKPVGEIMSHDSPVNAAAFSPDGKMVVTGSDDGTVRSWDAYTGKQIGPVLKHPYWITAITFTSDRDSRAALIGSLWNIRLWSVISGKQEGPVFPEDRGMTCAAYGPGDEKLITGDLEGEVLLWREPGKTPDYIIIASHEDRIGAVAFSLDGKTVITGAWDGTVRLWYLDAEEGISRNVEPNILLEDWQKKLALKFDQRGKIVPMWPLKDS